MNNIKIIAENIIATITSKEFDFKKFVGNYIILEVDRGSDDMISFYYPTVVAKADDTKSLQGLINQLKSRFRSGNLDVLYWHNNKYLPYTHVIP